LKAASFPAVQLQQKQPAKLEGFVSSPADQPAVQMNAITVYGAKDRDSQGYDDVYEKNYSTVYAGKDLIERFKGSSPADLFKGMSNVYSGDARNSGAVDPNIRGIQGPGRIALTVDGTEQSLAAWRGYNGVSNRNYIDPNLIGGMQVIKGPNQVRDVKSGIGGAVVVNTLSASDIVKAGESWGGEIKLEGSNNTIKERLSPSYDGRDYRDVVEELGLPGWTSQQRQDPILYKPLRSSSSNDFLNMEDQAARIALATKQDNFELLGAYAWRERGKEGVFARHDFDPGDGLTVAENFPIAGFDAGVEKPG
jgi:hemoglobin/transferrin/lactoferrin receptor protein